MLQLSLPAPHVQEERSHSVQGLQQEGSGAAEGHAGRVPPQLGSLYFPDVCRVYGHSHWMRCAGAAQAPCNRVEELQQEGSSAAECCTGGVAGGRGGGA